MCNGNALGFILVSLAGVVIMAGVFLLGPSIVEMMQESWKDWKKLLKKKDK